MSWSPDYYTCEIYGVYSTYIYNWYRKYCELCEGKFPNYEKVWICSRFSLVCKKNWTICQNFAKNYFFPNICPQIKSNDWLTNLIFIIYCRHVMHVLLSCICSRRMRMSWSTRLILITCTKLSWRQVIFIQKFANTCKLVLVLLRCEVQVSLGGGLREMCVIAKWN